MAAYFAPSGEEWKDGGDAAHGMLTCIFLKNLFERCASFGVAQDNVEALGVDGLGRLLGRQVVELLHDKFFDMGEAVQSVVYFACSRSKVAEGHR